MVVGVVFTVGCVSAGSCYDIILSAISSGDELIQANQG